MATNQDDKASQPPASDNGDESDDGGGSMSYATPPSNEPLSLMKTLTSPQHIPCFRSSMLMGMQFGAGSGLLAYWMLPWAKRNAMNSSHVAMGTFIVLSSACWINCRQKYAAQRSQLRTFMAAQEATVTKPPPPPTTPPSL
eukprot:TRINITY_DN4489_c0_g1_i1.p1 TRINITY_DN4489_c0_g1~~TRINITY_DN4489_c0_g1_i1.p1  ORF type:complete len:141 (-),score=35.48 TRINITY_DN4489_c0_g1_i1:315-737(-)